MTTVPTPPPLGVQKARPKWDLLFLYALCPVLLGFSVYGFWGWLSIPTMTHLMQRGELFTLICLVVMPLALFLFLSVKMAQKIVHNKQAVSYQMRLDHLQHRLNTQEDFIHSVTDNNPEAVAIFDKDNRYWFVNRSAAQRLGSEASEVIKKPLEKLIGYERAAKIEKRLSDVRSTKQAVESLDQIKDENGQVRFMQSHYEMIAPFGDFTGGVILREADVTNLIVERERRSGMLRQVIGTLVAVVDRRDPYAIGHSARVGRLARLISEELLLSEKDIEATEIAGSLMNFGKVLVPREILTKTTALTTEELQLVRDSILTSADILSIIDFDGPVVATLRQVMERFDGTGVPEGLRGNSIIMTARVLAVANAYVALVSTRAHRPSLPFNEALDILIKDNNKFYDHNVVLALSNALKNRRDALDWMGPSKQS